MKLIIKDRFYDTNVIPRIGEHIYIGYMPAAVVKDVIYDFEKNVVCIEVN